jgi:hypothetical protein
MQKRKLFISFTGLMYALKAGRITDDDLPNGLFVFGCTRDHVITPGSWGEHIESVVVENPAAHSRLVDTLIKAELEGRVVWRSREEGNASFELVNKLLVGNGEQPLLSHEQAFGNDDPMPHYNYSSVKERCPHMEVVF